MMRGLATKVLVFALVGTSLLSACRSRSDDSTASELDGSWLSTCRSRTDQLGTNYFEINALAFSGANMTSSIRSYSDAACKTELSDKPILTGVSNYSTGDFTLGSGGARKFDSQLQTLTITLTTDAYVALYNGTNGTSPPVCGGGFVKNQPKALTAASCASSDALRSEFAPRYDIFKVSGTLLYFGYLGPAGSASDGSSDSTRPPALDPSYFTKI
jgi:hypothetical protein